MKKTTPRCRAAERLVIEKSLQAGIQPRAEITNPDQARYYQDLGVRHFNLGVDLSILFNWWRENGSSMRKIMES